MIITTSTTGRTRLGAVATPMSWTSLRSAAPVGVAVHVGGDRGVAAALSVEPVGSALLPQVYAVVIDGGPVSAPKNAAQLRASVRWSDDL